ncbi:hypothetical protein G9A89_023279 [Geosiphon pyriformis]|nr:hypothetical protein G9A89_023279 [Geosiphon pyriformis]
MSSFPNNNSHFKASGNTAFFGNNVDPSNPNSNSPPAAKRICLTSPINDSTQSHPVLDNISKNLSLSHSLLSQTSSQPHLFPAENQQQLPFLPQRQQQTQHENQKTTGKSPNDEKTIQKISTDELATRQDVARLEKTLEDLVQILEKTSLKNLNENSSFSTENNSTKIQDPTQSSSTHNNSIIIDLPILGNDEYSNFENQASRKSPLSALLNHTYPESVVDLVNKMSNFSRFSFNPNASSSKVSTCETANKANTVSPAPPSRELCRQLIEDFFNQFNVYLPILDRRKFIDHWRDKSKPSQLIVSATLAVAATRFSDDPSIQKTQEKPGGVFYDAAKKLLDTMYDKPRIETCQALFLLAHAQLSTVRFETALVYLGMAVQMSHSLRLAQNEPTILPEEDEERRRVFYCIYCVDRWLSFVLGNPFTIDDINVNVPLPTLPSANRLTRNFFVSYIKLSRILGQIWKFGYSSQPTASTGNWIDHAMDPKSMLRQIRGALAKWLQDLPEDLQYQYLPSTDRRTIFQLASFTTFAGHLNILFHTCLILLHQPYIKRQSESGKMGILHQGPVKTCLTAACTITDIAKVTRQLDKNSFKNFQYSIYGLFQSAVLELVVMNGSQEHSQNAKKLFNDTLEELRFVGTSSNIFNLNDSVKELEDLAQIANGGGLQSGIEFVVPLKLAAQWLDNPGTSMGPLGVGSNSSAGSAGGFGAIRKNSGLPTSSSQINAAPPISGNFVTFNNNESQKINNSVNSENIQNRNSNNFNNSQKQFSLSPASSKKEDIIMTDFSKFDSMANVINSNFDSISSFSAPSHSQRDSVSPIPSHQTSQRLDLKSQQQKHPHLNQPDQMFDMSPSGIFLADEQAIQFQSLALQHHHHQIQLQQQQQQQQQHDNHNNSSSNHNKNNSNTNNQNENHHFMHQPHHHHNHHQDHLSIHPVEAISTQTWDHSSLFLTEDEIFFDSSRDGVSAAGGISNISSTGEIMVGDMSGPYNTSSGVMQNMTDLLPGNQKPAPGGDDVSRH